MQLSEGNGLHRAIFPRTWTDDLMDCGFSVMGLVGIKSMPGTTSYSRPWDARNTQFDNTLQWAGHTKSMLPLKQLHVPTRVNWIFCTFCFYSTLNECTSESNPQPQNKKQQKQTQTHRMSYSHTHTHKNNNNNNPYWVQIKVPLKSQNPTGFCIKFWFILFIGLVNQ